MNDQPLRSRPSDLAELRLALRTINPVTSASTSRARDVAQLEIEARRRRRMVFGEDGALLGDPVWDALLALFVADADGRALSASSLGHAMHLPPSTGLRWIDHMEARELLTKTVDPADKRRSALRPTVHARALVIQSLEPLWREHGVG